MTPPADVPAWIAFFLGVYALAAAAGELRDPGQWAALLDEFERSVGLRYVTAVVVLTLGAALFLASPWHKGDALAIAINVLGGLAVAEGLLMLAAADRFLALARRLLASGGGMAAGASVLFGAVAIIAGAARLS